VVDLCDVSDRRYIALKVYRKKSETQNIDVKGKISDPAVGLSSERQTL